MTHKEPPRPADRTAAEAFGPLDDTYLRRRKNDLLRRARLVIEFGWEQFRYQWSNGEVLGTALVLHDHDEMLRWAETVDSVQCRWAFALWGIDGGHTDVNAGCAATLAWFDSIRAELAGNRSKSATTWRDDFYGDPWRSGSPGGIWPIPGTVDGRTGFGAPGRVGGNAEPVGGGA